MPEKKKYVIKVKVDENERKKHRIYAILTNDGILARCLVYIYVFEPLSISQISEKILEVEQIDIDRTTIWRKVRKLIALGLVKEIPVVEAIRNNKNSKLYELVRKEYEKLCKRFDGNVFMMKKLRGMSFYATTKYSEMFLEWAIKKHNLPFDVGK